MQLAVTAEAVLISVACVQTVWADGRECDDRKLVAQ